MARYDVFDGAAEGSYLLDLQTDLIDHLSTRVVVPLLPSPSAPPPVKKLNPVFEIGGRKFVMATQLIATVPTGELGESRLSLIKHQDQIADALDMLFQGF
jgi:toxin CcdB